MFLAAALGHLPPSLPDSSTSVVLNPMEILSVGEVITDFSAIKPPLQNTTTKVGLNRSLLDLHRPVVSSRAIVKLFALVSSNNSIAKLRIVRPFAVPEESTILIARV